MTAVQDIIRREALWFDYFRARLPDQFDAILHIDQTSALEPLEQWAHDELDLPETYPSGV